MANSTPKNELSKGKLIALWVATLLPVALFLFAGGNKLAAAPPFPDRFVNHYGLPLWFLYVTGAVEVVGALLLAIPGTAVFGSLILVGTMVGAVLTHLKVGEYAQTVVPLVLLALVAIVGYVRRAPLLNLLAKLGIAAKREEDVTNLKAA